MTTMFCAGKATADWLGDLRQSGSFEESDLEELEGHLEDEIRQLVDSGLSDKEAFWVAMGRVGNRNDLPGEYAKTNSRAVWRHRFLWMGAGVVGYLGFNCSVPFLYRAGAIMGASAGIDGSALLIAILVLMIAVTSAALLLAWRLLPRMNVLRTRGRDQAARQSRKKTVLLYLLCVAAVVVVFSPYLYWYSCGWFLPAPSPEVTMVAQDAHLAAREIFALLFAVFLASIIFAASGPGKRDCVLTPGK